MPVDHSSVNASGLVREPVELVRRRRKLAPRLRERLALFLGENRGDGFPPIADRVRGRANRAPQPGILVSPGKPAALCRGQRRVNIFISSDRDRVHHLLRRGIHDLLSPAIGTRSPLSFDVQIVRYFHDY